MFDFGNANDSQRQAISTIDGPVLITAGPGTGKTFTLVQRAIYLIEERGVEPEEIFISTFTEIAHYHLDCRCTNNGNLRVKWHVNYHFHYNKHNKRGTTNTDYL